MFALTVKQRIAALVLLVILAMGGLLLFLSENKHLTYEYSDDTHNNQVYVDVCGAVARPGVLRVKPGTRKFEVLKMAGGSLPEADLNRINLAEYVEDGEQVYLPKKGEILEPVVKKRSKKKTVKQSPMKAAPNNAPQNEASATVKMAQTGKKGEAEWPIDLNSANQAQLETVPGIGEFMAFKIIEFRNKNGNFQSVEDLDRVYGVGPKKLAKLRSYLCVK
jgi:DNA uptake protein and related DNA-binding proteins